MTEAPRSFWITASNPCGFRPFCVNTASRPGKHRLTGATLITSNLPFDEWTETFGSESLTVVETENARSVDPRSAERRRFVVSPR